MPQDKLIIRGARVNNLKNITVEIPKNKLVVITGLSGSGKSSLAFDTIFAEGQRRYIESLSSFARQFLELQDKPDVDEIKGLTPAIAIDQRGISENPRSTVGTITDISDYLRLLFARVGIPKCLECAKELSRTSTEEIVRLIKNEISKQPIRIFAPITRPTPTESPPFEGGERGGYSDLIERLHKAGFNDVRFNGKIMEVGIGIFGPKELLEDPEYVRLQILMAMELGDGAVLAEMLPSAPSSSRGATGDAAISPMKEIAAPRQGGARNDASRQFFFSKDLTCPNCGKTSPPFEPRNFSFNSPHGACAGCTGLGVKSVIIPELIMPNPRLSLAQGAIKPWTRIGANQSARLELLKAVAEAHKFSVDIPVGEISPEAYKLVLFGTADQKYEIKDVPTMFLGVIPELEARYAETDSDYIRKEIESYMFQKTCPDCAGTRLNPQARSVTFTGKNIAEISAMIIDEAIEFFDEFTSARVREFTNTRKLVNSQTRNLTDDESTITAPIIKEVSYRLNNLKNAGLGYLAMDRSSTTLSGGEGQRVRLAVQLSSPLSGVIYILDEPTVGLHERDTVLLLALLKKLLAQDNSVIVVEHDLRVMREADWIIDMGPGAGAQGGEIVAQGPPAALIKQKKSLTGAYLAGKKQIRISPPSQGGARGGFSRRGHGKALTIKGASAFNLKNIDVKIPLGKFVCVTGVSGSGKSTLILEILAKALAKKLYNAQALPGQHKEITGLNHIDKVIAVDQAPIGRTPRSNPATYTGIFSIIRDLYTEIPEAKLKGFDAGTFSFNVKGGRCESCAGEGYIKIPMQFMSEIFIVCSECHGSRYRPEALEIHYKNKNIADILKMSASEAKEFFKDVPLLREKLQVLEDVGLGYIRLGQPAPTLSGGEAQRVKLATELSRRATGKTLYILDEPTTGLHFEDIQHLLLVLERLVDKGNSILVIEHNMEVIKCADWVIDLGPDGGNKGGELVASGPPQDIVKVKNSYTGQYLKKILNPK